MKKTFMLLVAITMPILCMDTAYAEERPIAVYDVTEFGANGADSADDAEAIQKALDKAIGVSDNALIQVTIPAGNYYLEDKLRIYSNTLLKLDEKATLIRKDETTNMLVSLHCDSDGEICPVDENCPHTGYQQAHNITIEGGVWDGNVKDTSLAYAELMTFAHANNITIQNTELKNCAGMHMLNCDGIASSKFINITFRNHMRYTGEDLTYYVGDAAVDLEIDKDDTQVYWNKEALHIDSQRKTGGNVDAFPIENLGCENIIVKDCKFINGLSGIGCHYTAGDVSSCGIIISGNSFELMNNNCINLPYWSEIEVTKNTVNGARMFLYTNHTDGTVTENIVNGLTYEGILGQFGSDILIADNTLNFSATAVGKDYGINIDASTAQVNNNTIDGAGNVGVAIRNTDTVTVKNNTVTNVGVSGFIVDSSTLTLTENTVTTAGSDGFEIRGSSTVTLTDNEVNGVGAVGVMVSDSVVTLSECTISDAATVGVYASASSNLTMNTNEINCGEAAAVMLSGSTGTLSNNIITLDGGDGITALEGSKLTATGNTITNPGTGISISDASELCNLNNNVINSAYGNGITVKKSNVKSEADEIVSSSNCGFEAVASTVTVNDCTITNAASIGIYSSNATVNIYNATISGNTETAVYGCADSTLTIDSSTIKDGVEKGILFAASAGTVKDSTITIPANNGIVAQENSSLVATGNTITSGAKAGISIVKSEKTCTISGNTINSPIENGIYLDTVTSGTISDNIIDAPGTNGIQLNSCGSAVTISKNTINQPKVNGVRVSQGSGTISDNSITAPGSYGVYCTGTDKVTVEENKIKSSTSAGIAFDLAATGTIVDNEIIGALSNGISVQNTSGVLVSGNTITEVRMHGVVVNNATAIISDNTITSASYNTTTYSGVSVTGDSSGTTISGNTIKASGAHGVVISGTMENCVVSRNTISETGKTAIYNDKASGTLIDRNIVSETTTHGIQVNAADDFVISNNVVSDAGNNGISINEGNGGNISGNTVVGSANVGISCNNATELQIDKNLAYNNTANDILAYGVSTGVLKDNQYGKVGILIGATCTFEQENNVVYVLKELSIIGKVSSAKVKMGNSVTISGEAAGGIAPYTYSYLIYNVTTDTWIRLTDSFVSTSSYKWQATAAGSYQFCVEVKDILGTTIRSGLVEVEVEQVEINDENPFGDVHKGQWFYKYVMFAYENGLMSGKGKMDDGVTLKFDPSGNMTRAEFVQMLYAKEGKPAVEYADTFTDVKEKDWFANAVIWANQNGIVKGTGDKFNVSGNITRQEMAAILYKYAVFNDYDVSETADLASFVDDETVSGWAVTGMQWAVKYGVVTGKNAEGGLALAPNGTAIRAEAATMMRSFMVAYEGVSAE